MSPSRKTKKQIALVIYPGFSLLELVAAHHVWVSATMMSDYETVVVGPNSTTFLPSSTPLPLRPQKRYAEVPNPYALFVIGGDWTRADQEVTAYVRQAAAGAEIIGSFSTGALILGAAGLLEGKRATTHWAYADQLQGWGARYERQPWVKDGRIWTGAGISAAVDMSLLLVSHLRSYKTARQVQIMAEWDPQPPGGRLFLPQTGDDKPLAHNSKTGEAEKTIALVIYPGLTVFDLVGPLEMMSALARLQPSFRPLVVAETIAPLTSDSGLTFLPNRTFAEVAAPHVLIVPGGGTPTLRGMSNPALRRYLLAADHSTRFTTSVCTGALLLASIGLLRGREATTHWGYAGYLPFYGARYQQERWVQSGKIISSAGVSAGIDMTLHLIAQLTNAETARQIQLAVHYDPTPPFGRIDYERLPFQLKVVKTMTHMLAPFYTHKPRRLLAQGI